MLPKEYQEYGNHIAKLREYGLGLTAYKEIIEWLDTHNRNNAKILFFYREKRKTPK